MTPTWAMHFSYQVLSFIISVAMVLGVATYAFTKSYDERKLTFVDGFTVIAHSGAFDTPRNSMESINKSIEYGVGGIEVDVRQRPDGTVVIGNDIIATNSSGIELKLVFDAVKNTDIKIDINVRETRLLPELYTMITSYGYEDRVFLTGIEEWNINAVKENCPGIDFYITYIPSRIKIFSTDYQQKLIKMLERTGACGIQCNHANASRTLSDLLHDNGYKLSVWTVDKYYHMKRALVNKPDVIITNHPDELQQVIDDWGHEGGS